MKNPWIIIGIITVLLFGGAVFYSSKSSEKNNKGIEILTHTKGNSEATVKLTEYSDFQCPACASFQPVLDQALEEYGDSIDFEYKHFLITRAHPFALQAGTAAEAAGQQGKFFEFHDLLFANQNTWPRAAAPTSHFIKYAEQLELDVDTFRRHMNSSMLRDKVQAEMKEGLAEGVSGTPTFFLNGKKMSFQTFQEFIEQIAVAIDPSAVSSSTQSAVSNVRFGL